MKLFVIHKNTVITYFLVIAAICSVFTLSRDAASSVFEAMAPKKDLPIYNVQKDEKICAISFDAAWGNEDTGRLIEILKQYNVKTTFFVVGSWVEKYPESVKELSDAGHEVMNHSSTHPHMPKLSKEQMQKEVSECNEKIEKITNKKPILFRPPYGDYNDTLVSTMREMGMYTIQWDVDSLDWKELDAQTITSRVTSRVKPGSIVLFHNAAKHTPEALPKILESLINDGYKIVPVSELIYKENFTVDVTGKQITATEAKESSN